MPEEENILSFEITLFPMEGKKPLDRVNSLESVSSSRNVSKKCWLNDNWLCWDLTTRQTLWVILCRLPEKGRMKR